MTAVEIAGLTLLHFLWQGAAIALAMQVVLALVGHGSAARYAIACAALATIAAVPMITSARLVDGASPTRPGAISWLVKPPITSEAMPLATNDGALSRSAVASSGPPTSSVLEAIVWTWALGVALLTMRTAAGWWRVRRLHKQALAQPPSMWQRTVGIWAARLRLWCAPHVVESTLTDTPAVVGWIRPVVLLPVASLAGLTPAQVEAILVHELAHIRRHDYLMNLVQSLVETVLFYHPAVWWVSATVRAEREHCCDDVAVRLCGDRQAYADALVMLESRRFVRHVPAPAATSGPLASRVKRILQLPTTSPRRPSPVPALGLALGLATASVLIPEKQSTLDAATQPTANRFDWAISATDHVDIYYRSQDAASVDAVARAAEAAYTQVSTALRHDLALKVAIVVLTAAEFSAAGPRFVPKSLGPSAPGPQLNPSVARMVVPVDLLVQQPRLIAHEMTHQFLFDLLPQPPWIGGIPAWLHEGLAEYMAGAWTPVATRAVRAAVAGGTFLPSGRDGRSPQPVDTLRHLGHAAVDFIDHEFGQAGIRRFLSALRSSAVAGGPTAIEIAFGMSATDFDREFEQFVEAQFPR